MNLIQKAWEEITIETNLQAWMCWTVHWAIFFGKPSANVWLKFTILWKEWGRHFFFTIVCSQLFFYNCNCLPSNFALIAQNRLCRYRLWIVTGPQSQWRCYFLCRGSCMVILFRKRQFSDLYSENVTNCKDPGAIEI